MGQAKRRRNTIGATMGIATDPNTGKQFEARYGGRLTEFLSTAFADQTRAVPCNGCFQCCYHNRIDVDPEMENPEDLLHLDLEPNNEAPSGFILRHREDGACIHLDANNRCSIYEHRPRACRLYDCRVFSTIGVVDAYNGGRNSPTWLFDPVNFYGEVTALALRLAAQRHIDVTPKWTATTVLLAAFRDLDKMMPFAAEIIKSKKVA